MKNPYHEGVSTWSTIVAKRFVYRLFGIMFSIVVLGRIRQSNKYSNSYQIEYRKKYKDL